MKFLKINALFLLLASFSVHAGENQTRNRHAVYGAGLTATGTTLLADSWRLKNPNNIISSWQKMIRNYLVIPRVSVGLPMTVAGGTLLFKWYDSNVRPYYTWQSPVKKVQTPVILQSPVRKR